MKQLLRAGYASERRRQQNYDCGYAFLGITELRINHETSQTMPGWKKPDEEVCMSTSTRLDAMKNKTKRTVTATWDSRYVIQRGSGGRNGGWHDCASSFWIYFPGAWLVAFPIVANRRILLGAVTARVVGGLLVQQEAGVPSPGEEWCSLHPALHLAKTSAQI